MYIYTNTHIRSGDSAIGSSPMGHPRPQNFDYIGKFFLMSLCSLSCCKHSFFSEESEWLLTHQILAPMVRGRSTFSLLS